MKRTDYVRRSVVIYVQKLSVSSTTQKTDYGKQGKDSDKPRYGAAIKNTGLRSGVFFHKYIFTWVGWIDSVASQ